MSICSRCKRKIKNLISYGDMMLCKKCIKFYDNQGTGKIEGGSWLIRTTDKHIMGPYEYEQLCELISEKKVVFLDEVSRAGEDWALIKNIDSLKNAALQTGYDLDEATVGIDITGIAAQAKPKRKDAKPPAFKEPKVRESRVKHKRVFIAAASGLLVVLVLGTWFYIGKRSTEPTPAREDAQILDNADYFNTYYIKGREYEEGGIFKDALRYYNRALTAKPYHPGVRIRRAAIRLVVFSDRKSTEKQLQELYTESNIGKIPDHEEQCDIRTFLGILEFQKGNYESAIGFFNQALALRPTHAYLYYNIGRILFKKGRYVEALEYFRNAQKLSPLFVDAILYEGKSLIELSRFRDAYDVFSTASLQNANVREFYTFGAHAGLKSMNPDSGFNMLKKVIPLDPFYYKKAFTPLYQIKREDTLEDEILYTKDVISALSEPYKTKASYVLSLLYFVGGEINKAYKLLDTDIGKDDPVALSLLGMVYFHKKRYKKAEEKVREALELDYSNTGAHLYAGRIYLRSQDIGQALNHFIKARSGGEVTSIYAMTLQGDVYLRYGKTNDALILWKKVLSIDSHYIPAWKRILKLRKSLTNL